MSDPLFKTNIFNKGRELDKSSGNTLQVRSKKDMARYFGTALFARVCMWGFGVYVALEPNYQTPEYQSEDSTELCSKGLDKHVERSNRVNK